MRKSILLLPLLSGFLLAFIIVLVGLGYKAFHGRNLFKWIHKHRVVDFEAMTDLSKTLRARLQEALRHRRRATLVRVVAQGAVGHVEKERVLCGRAQSRV